MAPLARRFWSVASAISLAVITLFVFLVLQNYGPESSVRRFHTVSARINSYIPPTVPFANALAANAIHLRDAAELQQITVQPIRSSAVSWLVDQTRALAYQDASFRVARTDYRTPSSVLAAVIYQARDNSVDPRVWVVQRSQRSWRVDAKETLTVWSTLFGNTSQ